MAWFYERVPSLGIPNALGTLPRLFRWSDNKIPKSAEAAEALLQSITSSKIVSIQPFPEEIIPRLKEAEMLSHVERLKKVVDQQYWSVINMLKRKCALAECDTGSRG